MSTYIYDQDGYVDEIGNSATLEGLYALIPFDEVFAELFNTGKTERIDDLLKAIDNLDMDKFDIDTQKSIQWLEEILERCVGIVILTDGCGFMPPGMTEDDYT